MRMKSRWVEYRGQLYERPFFEPPLKRKPGACVECGGLGVVPEELDPERYDVAVPCWRCHVYCKPCGKYVKRSGHACAGEKP